MYVYIQSEKNPPLYTVGHYRQPDNKWIAESDHTSKEKAAAWTHYLNGGKGVIMRAHHFTEEQLGVLLRGVIDMFLEFRAIPGLTEDEARLATVDAAFEGLGTDHELVELG